MAEPRWRGPGRKFAEMREGQTAQVREDAMGLQGQWTLREADIAATLRESGLQEGSLDYLVYEEILQGSDPEELMAILDLSSRQVEDAMERLRRQGLY